MGPDGVIYVANLDTMASFYEHCLGLVPVDSSDGYRLLESDGWTLSLVKASAAVARRITTAEPPRRRIEVPIKLAFHVASIDQIRGTAPAFGGLVDSPDSQWTFRALVHCDGVDPEGNVIQLLEPLKANASI